MIQTRKLNEPSNGINRVPFENATTAIYKNNGNRDEIDEGYRSKTWRR